MNIAGGASFSTPFWQTENLRLGVVSSGATPPELVVRLSCGTQVRARCPEDIDVPPGTAVRVARRNGAWHIEASLETQTGDTALHEAAP